MGQAPSQFEQSRFDRRAVKTLLADYHEAPVAGLSGAPGAVELVREAFADALNQQAHRLARHLDKALHAQDVMVARHASQFSGKDGGVRDRLEGDDERVEIVVIVTFFSIVARWAREEIILGGRGEAEQHVGVELALMRRHDLDGARNLRGDFGADFLQRFGVQQIRLVEQDQVGAKQLVFVDLLQRIVMIERGVRARCRGKLASSSAKRPSATAAASTTAITPSTVSLALISGQSKAFTSGLGRASPEVSIRMWSGRGSRASRLSMAGRKSSATVQHRQPLASSMILSSEQDLDPTVAQDLAVDADVAELVDDKGEAAALGMGQHMADERGLARAQESGDDGDGDLGEVSA